MERCYLYRDYKACTSYENRDAQRPGHLLYLCPEGQIIIVTCTIPIAVVSVLINAWEHGTPVLEGSAKLVGVDG